MAHDDDIPTPETPETPAEKAKAESFAELVDGMLAHESPPPALSADDRALLELATMVRAGSHDAYDLSPERTRSIVDDALSGGAGVSTGPEPVVDQLARYRVAPWAAAVVAAAAALLLWLRPPPTTVVTEPVAELPAAMRSRPSDALVGRIDRARSGDASARIDQIFADRSAGYRAVTMRRTTDVRRGLR
jgi:hypothetical protein